MPPIWIIIIKFGKKQRIEENIVLTLSEEDANSGVAHDALLHLESLFVVTTGQSEDVSSECITQNFAVNLLAHFSFVDGATKIIALDTIAYPTRQVVGRVRRNILT